MSNDVYKQVFQNNQQWAEQMKGQHADFFDNLAKGQSPDFLFIGCSDSRVPETQLMGLGPGQVFVHRNVANVVSHTDDNIQAVIEYAVNHLHVKHIVVCGHTSCGGVAAAMGNTDLGSLNGYLAQIRDVYYANLDALEALEGEARYRRLIELNVEAQCVNVIKSASVQQHWAQHDFPSVHGWVFDLSSGLLQDLDLDFDAVKGRIAERYALSGNS
ncbi:MAG: carbonic anhydrase [Myxococcota bacterium]|jgi:carbonic anhydrase